MYAENKEVKIWYEIHGQGEPTLILAGGFQLVHSEMWKRNYVPFLSRHMRVITFDSRGSGKSDKPPDGYDLVTYAEDMNAVIESAGLDRFAMAGMSMAVRIMIKYYAIYPQKPTHLILINGPAGRNATPDFPEGLPKKILDKNVEYWAKQPQIMFERFLEGVCTEKYSLRTKELMRKWASEAPLEMWATFVKEATYSDVTEHLSEINIPVLILSAEHDLIAAPAACDFLRKQITGSRFISIPEAGHGLINTWPQVCRHILDFIKPEEAAMTSKKTPDNKVKILWLSSPIGLGHIKRDLAIAQELRKKIPDLLIHWLAVDPVRSVLEHLGEQMHPLSDELGDESGHFESHSEAYALNPTEAYWEMDKLLANNFMVFTDAVREESYDLVVGDESWEVVDYLHYNPSLKTAPFVFMTDFVGVSNVSEDATKQAHVRDVNGKWVETRETHPEASDLSIFIGEPEDIPDELFGEGLPNRREWTKEHFKFSGYVIPFDADDYADHQALRTELGFKTEEKIILVSVGGTATGRPLIEKCLHAHTILKKTYPHIKTVVLCGPRIDSKSFDNVEDVSFLSFIQDPIKLFAACDLAVIQGGLSTAMELTALGRPFLYFPLKDHFEQQHFVDLRLKRYQAGIRLDYDETSPSQLAEAIAKNMGSTVHYKTVNRDGSKKAADMILELLPKEMKR